MTSFQMMMTAVFVAVAAYAYRKEVTGFVGGLLSRRSTSSAKDNATVVSDLLFVTNLRAKLSDDGCKEGVDACTNLLRVLVDRTAPAKVSN